MNKTASTAGPDFQSHRKLSSADRKSTIEVKKNDSRIMKSFDYTFVFIFLLYFRRIGAERKSQESIRHFLWWPHYQSFLLLKISDYNFFFFQECKEYGNLVYVDEAAPVLRIDAGSNKVSKCSIVETPLIVGGTKAKPMEFPHMVNSEVAYPGCTFIFLFI